LEVQAPHDLKFEPPGVRTFHSPTLFTGQALGLLPIDPKFEPNIGRFN